MPTPDQVEQLQKMADELTPSDAPLKMVDELKSKIAAALAQPVDTRGDREVEKMPWNGLTLEQKLERMRHVVKDLERVTEWHGRRFQELSERILALDEHAHSDGKVMIPVASKRRGECYGSAEQKSPIEGWF